MTDNDIKKALEWCEQFENNIVFKGNGDKKCALALQMMVVIKHALKNYTRQKAEIERLKKTAYIMQTRGSGKTSIMLDRIYDVRKEAIKDVVEIIKEYAGDSLYFEIETDYFKDYLDSLVEEM